MLETLVCIKTLQFLSGMGSVLEISPGVGNGVNHGKSGSRTYLVGNVVRNKFGHGEWCQSLPYDHNA